MGTLVFVCPTTGHEVSTGVDADRSITPTSLRRSRSVACVVSARAPAPKMDEIDEA
jgi:hypothetical protein